jgi:hypothetical protein
MRHRVEQSEWIRCALRASDLEAAVGAGGLSADVSALRGVIAHWVEAQYAFFTRAEERDERQVHRLEACARWLARLGFAGIVALVAITALEQFRVIEELDEARHHGLVVAIAVAAAAAAAIHGYLEKLALEAHTKRYARMRALYRSALRLLNERPGGDDPDRVRLVLRELGREALDENADWMMLHRDRPLELPTH